MTKVEMVGNDCCIFFQDSVNVCKNIKLDTGIEFDFNLDNELVCITLPDLLKQLGRQSVNTIELDNISLSDENLMSITLYIDGVSITAHCDCSSIL